jgi:site-specific DNA recombinase
MRCAIYTRYSSDLQNDRSIEDQERNCRSAAAQKGWIVAEDHNYADRAVSGTTTIGRSALQELLQAAKGRPRPFDYVLIDDTSRLSRNQADQLGLVDELAYLGINIYFVSQQIDSKDEQSTMMLLPMHGIKDSMYGRELAQKTKRGMTGQVLRGYNPGGKTYGYSYEREPDPSGIIDKTTGSVRILGTRISIDSKTGEIIREIFERFAAGWGYKEICKSFNERGIEPPGSENQRRGLRVKPSWCPNAIRNMLLNPRYGGDWTWNKNHYRTNRKTGKRRCEPRPKEEWVEKICPELRIVTDETWLAVRARFEKNTRIGYRRGGIRNAYLLSGLLRCEICGGRYVIVGGGLKNDPTYGCSTNWSRGKTVCSNNARVRKSELETRILGDLRVRLLRPDALKQIIEETNAKIKARLPHRPELLLELHASRETVQKMIDNLVSAIERGTFSDELLSRLRVKEGERKALDVQIGEHKRSAKPPTLKMKRGMLDKWLLRYDEILTKNDMAGRVEMQSILRGIDLRPVEIEGRKLLEGRIFPNYSYLFSVAGISSIESNGGGRI